MTDVSGAGAGSGGRLDRVELGYLLNCVRLAWMLVWTTQDGMHNPWSRRYAQSVE
jgi:hypothetical protein